MEHVKSESHVKPYAGRSFYFDSNNANVLVKGWIHFLLTSNDLALLQNEGETARLKIQADFLVTARFLLQNSYQTVAHDVGIHIRCSTGARDLEYSWQIPELEFFVTILEQSLLWNVKTAFLASPLEIYRTEISKVPISHNIEFVSSRSENFGNSTDS